jgi:hypothetical protein
VVDNGWLALERAALVDVHPSWLPDIEQELVCAARDSLPGQRWLAKHLTAQSVLFRYPPAALGDDGLLQAQPWLFQRFGAWPQVMLELGAMVCADTIRAIVSREQVLQLRRVLGGTIYERVLQYSKQDGLDRALLRDRVIPFWPLADEALQDRFQRLAAVEICHQAQQVHAIAGERMRMAFPREWLMVEAKSQLREQEVAACLHRSHSEMAPLQIIEQSRIMEQ